MKKLTFSPAQCYSLAALFIAILGYSGEKALKMLTPWSQTSAIFQAIAMTIGVALIWFLINKSKDVYFGILAAIMAFKIFPPDILMLRTTNIKAAAVYYLVRKAALALFLLLIYRLYNAQSKTEKDKIHLKAIIILLVVFPFLTGIANEFSKFAFLSTGSMMLPYAISAAVYILSMAVFALVCFLCKGKSAALISDFAILSLALNTARKASAAIVISTMGEHLSKSYICWIIIYISLIVMFTIVKSRTKTPDRDISTAAI